MITTDTHYTKIQNGFVDQVFRTQYCPGEKVGDHLEFALNMTGSIWDYWLKSSNRPLKNDLQSLMKGLINSHKRMKTGNVSPIIHAATIAYGFVFLHPFEDGNGRIHRFLIHNILSLQGMVPRGLMLPVSAVMLKYTMDYNASLEAFSRPLLQLIDYRQDEMGQMAIENDTACGYQYMDMTPQAEALYEFVSTTIEEELMEELNFLVS